MKRLIRYFRALQFDRDLDSEIEAHVEEKTAELEAQGVPAKEARERAIRQFGNRTRVAETSREQWTFGSLDEIVQDLRYTMRVLRRSPMFAVVAIATLALGIGSNAIIFSVVNHVLLRSLPYPQADRLIAVSGRSAAQGAQTMQASAADFYDWRAQSDAFESLSAYSSWPMNLTNVEEPRRLDTQLVSANLFSTLGVQAQLGRTFLPGEDSEQSPALIVISHHLWRALGEPSTIVGRELTLNGSPATVVGVMPASFGFPSPETDAWVPLSLSASNRANRDGRWLRAIGRLRVNTSLRAAQQSMDIVTQRLATEYAKTNAGWTTSLVPLQEELVGSTRPILLTLQGGTLLLLLITCANLTNLLMAKAAARTREIGLRAALGASRARILRQLIVETSVVAALGGGLGFLLAIEGVALVRTLGDGLIPRAAEIHVDAPVTLFALAATLVTALIFGLAPALQASRFDLRGSAGTRGAGSLDIERKRSLLIMIEVGLASVLLIGSGLLGESLVHLLMTPPGLRVDHALTVRLTLARSQYPTNEKQNGFLAKLLEDVRSLPGVTAVGEVSETPLKGNNPTFQFALEGYVARPSGAPVQAGVRAISPGYLATAGIPLREGRDFTTHDQAGSSPVAIINETMARRYWPGSDAIGKRVRFKEENRWITVAGIVPDIKHMGLETDEGPVLYFPYAQKTQTWLAWTTLLVRTTAEPMDVVPAIRAAIRSIDRNQPIAEIGTLEESLTRSTAIPRFTTSVIGAASSFALLIAVIGVYGLLAYAVAQRLPELGIRLALGASPSQVSWLLVRQAMLRVLAGVAVGMLIAWWLAGLLTKLLFGVRPHDPVTFAFVAALLVMTSLAAVLGPARRAMKIDPMTALRAE